MRFSISSMAESSALHVRSSNRLDDFLLTAAFVAEGILRQRLTQAPEHAVVINNQPKSLSG